MNEYAVSEIFTSLQGEGLYTGTPMTFIRFAGCSVGKKTCQYCDTDFEKAYPWKGGGMFTTQALASRVPGPHVCLTGGEPMDQDLYPLLGALRSKYIHIETSGTVFPDWMHTQERIFSESPGHRTLAGLRIWLWITVSPKPGYLPAMLEEADELKVIVPGLGVGEGWMNLEEALRWANRKPVFLQPRNSKHEIDQLNLQLTEELVLENPTLRLSMQSHKVLKVR
jgi:organic radical activating enzyme